MCYLVVYSSSIYLLTPSEYYNLLRTSVKNFDFGLEINDQISIPGNKYTSFLSYLSCTTVFFPPMTVLNEKDIISGLSEVRLVTHFSLAMF